MLNGGNEICGNRWLIRIGTFKRRTKVVSKHEMGLERKHKASEFLH